MCGNAEVDIASLHIVVNDEEILEGAFPRLSMDSDSETDCKEDGVLSMVSSTTFVHFV